MKRGPELLRLAETVVFPGFEGKSPPDWIRRRLGEGLAGVVLFSRNIATPSQVADLTAALREENPPVLVAIDEESGDVTRLEARERQHPSRQLRPRRGRRPRADRGASPATSGRDLAAAGVNLNFAPAADVNSNPDNPVIGPRSFGADPAWSPGTPCAWIRGLQSAGVAACAKHFPGHGDTSVDSHHGLPTVAASPTSSPDDAAALPRRHRGRGARRHDRPPARPALRPRLPATLSPRVLVGLLREELGFDGLIVTDGIEMAAVSGPYGIAGARGPRPRRRGRRDLRGRRARGARDRGRVHARRDHGRRDRGQALRGTPGRRLPPGPLASGHTARRSGGERPAAAPAAREPVVGLAAARRALRSPAAPRPRCSRCPPRRTSSSSPPR